MWAQVFGVSDLPEGEASDSVARLAMDVSEQISIAHRQLLAMGYPADLFATHFDTVNRIFQIPHLTQGWDTFVTKHLAPENLLTFRHAAHYLGVRDETVGDDVIHALLNDLAEWEREIMTKGLPPLLAEEILEHFAAVRRRLLEYRVRGGAAIREAIAIYGHGMEAAAEELQQAPPEVRSRVGQVWRRLVQLGDETKKVGTLVSAGAIAIGYVAKNYPQLEAMARLALHAGMNMLGAGDGGVVQ